jgi:hypothetical protein
VVKCLRACINNIGPTTGPADQNFLNMKNNSIFLVDANPGRRKCRCYVVFSYDVKHAVRKTPSFFDN